MSTDFQQARIALGARLRELRTEAGLTGRQLAANLGWLPSKVSKLENGKQTPSIADLEAWAGGVGNPESAAELKGRLRGFETRYRSWRRQLAGGHRARQEAGIVELSQTRVVRGAEFGVIPGIFQTAEYARAVLNRYVELRGTPRDVEPAVSARMRRQEALYEPGREFHALIWEGALRVLICRPDVLVGQLDRLVGLLGLGTVSLGIIPFEAPMRIAPGDGFWIYDDRLVISETWNAEMWLDDAAEVALFTKIWDTLNESAFYGAQAHRLIGRARAALDLM
ncbi:helix-turn-helix transcriptional regulator [Streptacidiphilus sp. PB12-B1b]|uniref:helix-turn-helix domain-containing protein n=1 Tax=Streptacidiphilus sp. PB12-B1b TaxID=2705012 RepID=UPI0015FD6CB1|nr:helix-turn-helix transcriptional regulator [Streptacidiphilus sp. PB12-B1b]QMU78584.1 helix-turn-helix transcriptional regulator [Streptacidiphilus sp. PB12-B1b]